MCIAVKLMLMMMTGDNWIILGNQLSEDMVVEMLKVSISEEARTGTMWCLLVLLLLSSGHIG